MSDHLILTWAGPYLLQSATNAPGPYSDLPAATSPYTNWINSQPHQFFRLRAVTTGWLAPSVGTIGQFTILGSGFGGYSYVLQTSIIVIDWFPLQTNAAPFQYVQSGSDASPMRFFRTVFAS